MRWTARLAAAAALGLIVPIAAFAQDEPATDEPAEAAPAAAEAAAQPGPSLEAVGTSSEEFMAAASTNVLGEPIAYATGTPQVSAWIITFEPEGHTNLHQHPAPSFVYVLEGELEAQVADGEPNRIKQGQAIIEPQDTTVQAFNVAGGPTKIIVVALASDVKAGSVPVTE